jgi:hypothetical protein
MIGPPGSYADRGAIPRAIEYLFAAAEGARRVVGKDVVRIR